MHIDHTRSISMHYFSLFFLRRAFFSLILIVFAGDNLTQLIMLFASSIVMLGYVLAARPFNVRVSKVLTILNEIGLLIIYVEMIFITYQTTLDGNSS